MTTDAERVEPGRQVTLSNIATDFTGLFKHKKDAEQALAADLDRLRDVQERLYVDKRYAVLLILQGMDTAGKDGTIRRLSGGINLLGAAVTSFRKPSEEEQRHDFLWRIHRCVPPYGLLGIFNRSQYEDVLVPVAHGLLSPDERRSRYEQINAFERMLSENRVAIVKCFLHISKDEQKTRFQARLDNREKLWKFDPADLQERERWTAYQAAYEGLLAACSTAYAPWYVVPADHKWYRNYVVTRLLVDAMEHLDLRAPKPTFDPTTIVIP